MAWTAKRDRVPKLEELEKALGVRGRNEELKRENERDQAAQVREMEVKVKAHIESQSLGSHAKGQDPQEA